MLGHRKAQRSLFDALGLPHRVASGSFYGRMAAVHDVLFQDDDLREMYCPDNGRPSVTIAQLEAQSLLDSRFYHLPRR